MTWTCRFVTQEWLTRLVETNPQFEKYLAQIKKWQRLDATVKIKDSDAAGTSPSTYRLSAGFMDANCKTDPTPDTVAVYDIAHGDTHYLLAGVIPNLSARQVQSFFRYRTTGHHTQKNSKEPEYFDMQVFHGNPQPGFFPEAFGFFSSDSKVTPWKIASHIKEGGLLFSLPHEEQPIRRFGVADLDQDGDVDIAVELGSGGIIFFLSQCNDDWNALKPYMAELVSIAGTSDPDAVQELFCKLEATAKQEKRPVRDVIHARAQQKKSQP